MEAEGGRKRRRTSGSADKSQSDDDGDDGDDAILMSGALFSSSPAPRLGPGGAGTSDGEGAEEETPLSSQTEGDLGVLQKKERVRSGPFADDEDEDEGREESEVALASRMRGESTKGSVSGDRMDVDGGSDAEDEEVVGMVSSRRDREQQRRRMAVLDDSDDE